jgi:hypothetical protein
MQMDKHIDGVHIYLRNQFPTLKFEIGIINDTFILFVNNHQYKARNSLTFYKKYDEDYYDHWVNDAISEFIEYLDNGEYLLHNQDDDDYSETEETEEKDLTACNSECGYCDKCTE